MRFVGGADQRPFCLHLLDPAQQELTEVSCLLDLAEHRLDHLLAQPIAAAIAGAPELGGHPGEERAGLGRPLGGCGLAAVCLSSGRDVAPDPPSAQRAQIGSRAVACIGRYLVRIAAQIGLDGVEQGSELRLVAAVVIERARNDDLRRRINCGLGCALLAGSYFGGAGVLPLSGSRGIWSRRWHENERAAVDVKTLHAKIGELTLENDS